MTIQNDRLLTDVEIVAAVNKATSQMTPENASKIGRMCLYEELASQDKKTAEAILKQVIEMVKIDKKEYEEDSKIAGWDDGVFLDGGAAACDEVLTKLEAIR